MAAGCRSLLSEHRHGIPNRRRGQPSYCNLCKKDTDFSGHSFLFKGLLLGKYNQNLLTGNAVTKLKVKRLDTLSFQDHEAAEVPVEYLHQVFIVSAGHFSNHLLGKAFGKRLLVR